jgi:hypothetical protein
MEQRKTPRPQGTAPEERLLWREGLEAKEMFSASGRRRNIFLDIPLYRSGDYTEPETPDLLDAHPRVGSAMDSSTAARSIPFLTLASPPLIQDKNRMR